MIEWELYAKIRRLKSEGVSMRRAAESLGISRNTLSRYWDGKHTPDDRKSYPAAVESAEKAAAMEALKAYFEENKGAPKKQRPNAKTAWVALRDRHSFGESTIRGFVRELKAKHPEAFVPLDFEPGEMMQVDWCEIKAVIDGYMHDKVPVFCAALPYSYAIFVAVMPDMTMASFVEGHMMAMEWFGGVVERAQYDNLKTAVFSGSGKHAVKQERFKALEAHYSFEAVFSNVRAGWEKGGVEDLCKLCRALAFTPVPNVGSLKELQDHAIAKCADYIKFHKVKGRSRPILDMYEEERQALRPLPAKRIEASEPVRALVAHDMTFRHNTTKYSLPMEYVGKTVTLLASAYTVEAWHGGRLVYTHERPYAKGKHQYIPEHYLPLLERKRRAMRNAAPLKYGALPPELDLFRRRCKDKDRLEQLANILLLAREADADKLLLAVECANKSGRPSYKAVRFYLELGDSPAGDVDMAACDVVEVEHADLRQYDELLLHGGEEG
jgi:transposase